MAHILILEVAGGNDFTPLEDAVALGHEVTFATADLAHYQGLGAAAQASLALAARVLEVRPFSYPALEAAVLNVHAQTPIDAVLCFIDIRLIEASDLAAKLGVLFLNPATTRLMRDKANVRRRLQEAGVRQPRFALAATPAEIAPAVAVTGYPALVKPADGYGSQNITVVRNASDLEALVRAAEALAARPADYGLGVRASNRWSVEQYVEGNMIGCDMFSAGGQRFMLGINDKVMFAPPSFAMRGSCFPSERYDKAAVEAYACAVLDAVDYDFGAAHIEMIVTPDGLPWLVEVNPRLVSAQIPHQMGYALEQSVYAELIGLHLGHGLGSLRALHRKWFSAIRWVTSPREGTLAALELPESFGPAVQRLVLFKQPGDAVRPPFQNSDRIAYAIAVGETQEEAEGNAEAAVAAIGVALQ